MQSIARRLFVILACLLPAWTTAAAAADGAAAPFTVTVHTIPAGDVTLEARYSAPAGATKPVPVIVTVAGSGFEDTTADPYTKLLVDVWTRAGIGVLAYNKRGSGKSGGTYSDTKFDQRARDVSAVVDYARTLPGIDKNNIGLWGISQAGWVMPRAAEMNAIIRFLVMVSPAGVNPGRQVGFYLSGEFRGLGLTAADAGEAVTLWETVLAYYATGNGYRAAQDAVTTAAGKPWFSKVVKHPFWHDMAGPGEIYTPERLAAEYAKRPKDFDFYRAPTTLADYASEYRRIRVPVLLIFGGKDTTIPAAESRAMFETAFRRSRFHDVKVLTYANADHSIQINEREVAPGYRETIRDWVLAHVKQ